MAERIERGPRETFLDYYLRLRRQEGTEVGPLDYDDDGYAHTFPEDETTILRRSSPEPIDIDKALTSNSEQRVTGPGWPDDTTWQAEIDEPIVDHSDESEPNQWSSSNYITNAIERIRPQYTLSDIGGLHDIKGQIEVIAGAFNDPDALKRWGAEKPQGIILYGEPGTGKTMLAHAVSSAIGGDFWTVNGATLYDMWLSLSEKNTQLLFDSIKRHKGRLVVFFDEIDSIFSISDQPGPGGAGQARNQVAGIFKREFNTIGREKPDVLVVAATNNLDRLDPALIRSGRFNHKLYIPLPDDAGRSEVVATLIAKSIASHAEEDATYSDDIDVAEIVRLTDGMSGADLSEIFRRVILDKAVEESKRGSTTVVSQHDIVTHVIRFKTGG